MSLIIFRKCGFFLFLLLVFILPLLAGCIDKSAGPAEVSSEVHLGAYQDSALRAEVDFDSQVSDSLFRAWGNLIVWGNGSLPYVIINATLWKERELVTGTKYMIIDVQSNSNCAFEIAKNLRLSPGDYSCTLEVSGPNEPLLCESRKCQISEPFQTGTPSLKERLEAPRLAASFQASVPLHVEDKMPDIVYFSSDSELHRSSSAKAEEVSVEKFSEVESSDNAEEEEVTAESAGDKDELKISSQAEGIQGGNPGSESLLGSTSSNKFHRPDCRYAIKIKPENRIYFSSSEEAQRKGYEPCRSCNPS